MGSRPATAVVVGAGFAGLAAAHALRRDGIRTLVIEARDRVGGRVWSQRLNNGAVVEMGAEFILPGNDTVAGLAAELGLELFVKGTTYGRREPRGGSAVDPARLERAHAAVAAAAAAGQLGGGTVAATLARLVADAASRDALLARVEVSGADDAEAQDDACLADAGKAVGDYPTRSVAGGNQLLAERLAAPLAADLHLGTAVRRIVHGAGGVRVNAGGDGVDADVCVVAVPAAVLSQIEFDPPLPAAVATAFARIRMGQAAKLLVPLAEPAGPSATLSVPERFWTYTQRAPDGTPLAAACSFAGGGRALRSLQVEQGPGRWLERVAALRPDLRLEPGGALLSTWNDDPWVRGAYSVHTPDAALADPVLTAPVGPIRFAGEHTAGDWHGLMDGALRSGLRAAAQVLAPAAGR